MVSFYETYTRCRPHILAAIELNHGTYNEEDILRGLLTGEFVLWPGANSAVVTEISEQPRMKVLSMVICGGELEELIEMEKDLETYARLKGCKMMRGEGRPGWGRAMPGYEPGGTAYKVLQ